MERMWRGPGGDKTPQPGVFSKNSKMVAFQTLETMTTHNPK
jgi:hypothetical protein